MQTRIYTSYLRERLKLHGIPSFFPGTQKEYMISRNSGIRLAREIINTGSSNDLFNQCISICSETRKNYAKKIGDKDYKSFGKRRGSFFKAYCTALYDPRYSEYGDQIRKKILSKVIANHRADANYKLQDTQIIDQQTFEGFGTLFEYKLLSVNKVSPEDQIKRSSLITNNSIKDQYGRPCIAKSYKSNYPELYDSDVINVAIKMLDDTVYKHRSDTTKEENIYILATNKFEIESNIYAEMSKYLIRVDLQYDHLQPSPVILIHQDSFLIDDTMKKIESIFNQIVKMSKHKPINKRIFRQKLGLFRYLFAQATPLERGSADCAGAMERALVPVKDIYLLDKRDVEMEVDLEALTATSLSEYMKRYMAGWYQSPT